MTSAGFDRRGAATLNPRGVARRADRTTLRGAGFALLPALVLTVAACGWGGGASSGGEKKGDQPKPAAAPNGFETSVFGHLSKTYDAGLTPSVEVVKEALKRLAIDVVDEKAGIFGTTLEGESKDGTSLVVVLKELSKSTTRISVKVGYLLGDKDAALRIHSEIQAGFDARKAVRPFGTGARTDLSSRPGP